MRPAISEKKGVPVTWRSKVRSTHVPERATLERFAKDALRFPGGEHQTRHCTGCARLVTERFGGETRGYWAEDNPLATAGEAEGGHDFALIAGRFIVDPWLYHYYGDSPVLDMDVPAERTEAVARYGPEENWRRVPDWPDRAKTPAAAQVAR